MTYCTDEVMASVLLVLINASLCFGSVIGEALIVELSQIPVTGEEESRSYVSLFFMWKYVGLLLSSLLKGFILEMAGVNTVFLISSGIPVLLMVSAFVIKEKKIGGSGSGSCNGKGSGKGNENNDDNENNNLLSKDDSFNTKNSNTKNTKNNHLNHKKLLSNLLSFMCNKFIYIPCLLLVAFNLFSPNFNDPLFYFLVDVVKLKASCFGIITFYSTLATLLAILIYQSYFTETDFKTMILSCSVLQIVFSFAPLLVVWRVHTVIPDYLLIIVYTAVNSMLSELVILPMLSLACLLCPKNLEATVYSVFVSALNLGNALANVLGAWMTDWYGVRSGSYGNLGTLIMMCNVVGIVPLPLVLMVSEMYFHPEKSGSSGSGRGKGKSGDDRVEYVV